MTTVEEDVREGEEGYRADLGTLAEINDVDEKTHRVVVDFPHNVLDGYRTDWGVGCWDESLAKQLPVMLWSHLPHEPIGRAEKYETNGVRTRIFNRFSDFHAVPRAEQAFVQTRDGDIPGYSFHYRDGRSVRHPTERSGRRYMKATMMETSPVSFPAIPGADVVDIRSLGQGVAAGSLSVPPDLATILQLGEQGFIDGEGIRALLTEHFPGLREHIAVKIDKPKTDQERIAALLDEHDPELAKGFRAMTVTIGDDGGSVTGDGSDDPTTLIRAIDATLDHAGAAVAGLSDDDRAGLPDPVQQALALMDAAGVAVDELQEVLGIDDPDDPAAPPEGADGERAQWTSAQINDLPDSSFAYIEDGGTKDGSGKTVPRSKRHFPIKDASGKLDAPHVRNALSRIGQGAEFAKEATPKVEAAAKELKIGDRGDSGDRALDEKKLEVDFDRAMDLLDKRVKT